MEAQLQHTLIRDTHQFGGSKKSSMEEKAPPGIEKKKPPCECFIRLSQCCQSQHTHCTSGSPGSRCVPHTNSATTLLGSWVRSLGNSDVPCHTETPGAPWHPREKMLKRDAPGRLLHVITIVVFKQTTPNGQSILQWYVAKYSTEGGGLPPCRPV